MDTLVHVDISNDISIVLHHTTVLLVYVFIETPINTEILGQL